MLDSTLQRSGATGTYSTTDKDLAIRAAMDWANVSGSLLRATTDLTIKPNDVTVDFSGVTNFHSAQFIDAKITDGKTSLNPASSARWNASSNGTSEYYYHADGATTTDGELREPHVLWDANVVQTVATIGSLTASTWAWGDNDTTFAFNTVYFRSSGSADPDGITDGNIECGYFDDHVSLRGYNDIREMHLNRGASRDRPKFIGFDTPTAAEVWPPSDDFYQLRVRYRAPITDFGLAQSSPDNIIFAMPEEYLHPIITFGAAPIVMLGDPTVYTQSGEWSVFQSWIRTIKGTGIDPGPTMKVAAE